ncbi:MAG: HI0074 family nucleotidyltransferase substrate-binding subunit [Clostridium sp.]|nr:HI0074 family nucleotidyltransferase substrate-binding subunit [Clostridium sp.]
MRKFDNYVSNLAVLEKAQNEDLSNEFIISGIIDKFAIQFEFSWKVLKELMRYEGKNIANTGSPRGILKAAYAVYPFIDEKVYLSMLKNRNDMSHIYDGNAAKRLVELIFQEYIPEFQKLKHNILNCYGETIKEIV